MPKSGCQDGNFTLKSLLHLRRQHSLESYVLFADLAKAFDTSNHELMVEILEKYGAPQNHVMQWNAYTQILKWSSKSGKKRLK